MYGFHFATLRLRTQRLLSLTPKLSSSRHYLDWQLDEHRGLHSTHHDEVGTEQWFAIYITTAPISNSGRIWYDHQQVPGSNDCQSRHQLEQPMLCPRTVLCGLLTVELSERREGAASGRRITTAHSECGVQANFTAHMMFNKMQTLLLYIEIFSESFMSICSCLYDKVLWRECVLVPL